LLISRYTMHGPIILGPCFSLFWFSGSKPATARTKSNKQFNPLIRCWSC